MLPDAGVDVAEASIDVLLHNELLRQIPIVKTFVGLVQVGVNIHDKLFLKKILTFLQKVEDVSTRERKETIRKIDESQLYRTKVGEKLLYILDACNDHENAEYIARLFSAVLRKTISYDDFLLVAPVVAKIPMTVLNNFLSVYVPAPHGIGLARVGHLLSTGFFSLRFNEVRVSVGPADEGEEPDVDVRGGETYAVVTKMGNVVFKVFAKTSDQERLDKEMSYRIRQLLK